MYKNINTGDIFENYDEAREDMYNTLTTRELAEKFFEIISCEELLSWGLKDSNFWEHWDNEIYDAEEKIFDETYVEIENE